MRALGPADMITTRSASANRFLEIVGDEQHRLRSAFQHSKQQIAHDLPGLGVERPNGSSISRILGSRISTAQGQRAALPPDSICG